mgnify:CR=1 FL=1
MRQSSTDSTSEIYSKLVKKGFFKGRTERPLVSEVLEKLDQLKPVIFSAPPGYGKTAVVYSAGIHSLFSWEKFCGCIHVLPMRAIVESTTKALANGLEKISIHGDIYGAEMMFVHSSQFLLKFLSFTTIDTYSLYLAKLPPIEMEKLKKAYGHYELSRGSIFNSLNVFDEVHLFLNEEKAGKVVRYFFTTIKALLKTQTPIVLMSATLPQNVLNALGRVGDFEIVEYSSDKDKDFRNEKLSIDLKTKLIDDIQIPEIVKEENFDKVLIVVNTVKRAVKVYEKLSDYNPILLHSRFRQKDREDKVSELLNKNKWVCVSTQVVEAGVDISADVLITDVCPASSLIQRSGRVARYTDEYGEMYIVKDVEAKPYSEGLVEQTCSFLSNRKNGEYVDINWKLPDTGNGYSKLLNHVHRGRIGVKYDDDFMKLIISPWSSREALKMMRIVGSFTRDSVIMPCYVGTKSRENTIPLTSKIAFNLIRNEKAQMMVDDEVLERFVKNKNHLEELLLEGRFEWISVDNSAYREEVGIVE